MQTSFSSSIETALKSLHPKMKLDQELYNDLLPRTFENNFRSILDEMGVSESLKYDIALSPKLPSQLAAAIVEANRNDRSIPEKIAAELRKIIQGYILHQDQMDAIAFRREHKFFRDDWLHKPMREYVYHHALERPSLNPNIPSSAFKDHPLAQEEKLRAFRPLRRTKQDKLLAKPFREHHAAYTVE